MKENESSSEPLTSVAVYNPALLKKDELIAQFVARRALLDRLVEELRGSSKNGRRHQLIVGARGSGKTMLLRRLCYAIEDTAELCSRWFPLVFPEEQYNVSRLSDLWVNCLDALSDMLERRDREEEAGRLDQRLDELPADDEKRRAQAALDLLIGWAKKENCGLVLLIDNADLIFDRLKNHHPPIREALSADNRLIIIGATNKPIDAIYDNEGAFHDLFEIHELRGLNDEETSEALRTLARLRRTPHVTELLDRDPGRIRSLNLLAGGNLRTVVVLYQALAQGTDDSVRADLEQLLDQYTPLYKHQFEALSAQSQQVVDALALNWDPATAADLAGKLRLDINAVSAVLNRLVKDGIVEKTPSPPGEKTFFQIAERFFNIWYLMRANRRVRRRLMWLVEFLKMFYGSAELNRRARQLVQEPPPPEPDQFRRAELALLFAGAVEKPGLRRALEIEGVRSLMNCEDRQRLGSALDLEGADASLKDLVERFQSLGELSQRIEQTKGELPPEFLEYLVAAPTLSLEEKKRTFEDVAKLGSTENKDLIEKFESEAKRFVELFGGETCRELFESIRDGQMADGADVEGADAAAIKGKDASLRVIARLFKFDRTKDRALLDQAEGILTVVQSPHVWLSWAEAVANSEDYSKKLAGMCKRAVKLKGHDARTWQRTGELQFHLGQSAEAESSFRKSMALDLDAFASWNDLGYLLAYCRGRFDEAEVAYRRAIELDPKAASPWFRLGDLLQRYLKRYEEAEAAFRKATELAPHVILPWGYLVQLLTHEMKKYEEAEAVCRKAIEHHPEDAGLWMNLGFLLVEHFNQRSEEAAVAFRKVIELNPEDAWSWFHLGRVFAHQLNWYEEAEAAYRRAIELDPRSAWSWIGLGGLLAGHLKRSEEAESAFRKAIELAPNEADVWMFFGETMIRLMRYEEAEAALRKAIELEPNTSSHWMNLGVLLGDRLKRYEEAEVACRKAIELNPNEEWPWFHLGRLFAQHLGRYEEAEAACRKGIELASDKAEAWLFFGNMMINLKNYEEAEAACRKVIELDPKEAHIWYAISHLMAFRLNKHEEAEAVYRKAIELNRNHDELTELWEQFAILLGFHLKRVEEAEAACRKAIEIAPNKSEPWRCLGRVLSHLKRYEEAEAAFRKAIELNPARGWPWHNLGLMLQSDLKRYDDAEAAFRKAVELDPNQPWSWICYGKLLAEPLKKYEEAEAAYLKAIELNPDLNFSLPLACILIKRGKWDDAAVYARKFISEGDDEYYEHHWPEIIVFFHDVVASGHADEAVALLDETEYGERWRPLREALRAIAEDDSSYLLRVAPEIRRPAEEIVAMLATEGVRLGCAPKPARGRRTRRKKSTD